MCAGAALCWAVRRDMTAAPAPDWIRFTHLGPSFIGPEEGCLHGLTPLLHKKSKIVLAAPALRGAD